jgi:hypothetical protein
VKRRCEHCGDRFRPRPNVAHQRYCSREECQRTRKREWHKGKLRTDEAYRDNQRDAQKRWRENHVGYWKAYRDSHPEYVERNRVLQRERNHKRRALLIAKRDESRSWNPMRSGLYRLIPAGEEGIAKMDEYLVKLDVLSNSYPQESTFSSDCKQTT